MKTLNLAQGSPEWHAHRAHHFNASEAPAMMGASKYSTRAELMRIKAGGEAAEVSSFTQALFDQGHATEALARPLVEALIGEELYPIVGVSEEHPRLAASFDGLTFAYDVGFEHKLWNEGVAAQVRDGSIADNPAYYWQMEQQLLVSGAEAIVFVCSDGTAGNFASYRYEPRPGRREQLIAGWAQFETDLAAYVPQEVKAAVVAKPVDALPAITYKLNGLALTSNLTEFKAAAELLIERSKAPLETDQDFADRDALCKAFGDAEKRCELLRSQVLAEIHDVDAFSRGLGDIQAAFRAARLAGEKLVEAEKKNRRLAIQQGAEKALRAHIDALNTRLARVRLPAYSADFAGAMKGKKTIASLQDAVDTLLARAKVETSAMACEMQANLATLDELAADYGFLFADLQQVASKAADDFRAMVQLRIAQHREKEEARLQAERERIRKEEAAKLEQERLRTEAAERARLAEEARAAKQAELRRQREQQEADLADMQRQRDELEQERARIAEQAQRMVEREQADHAEQPLDMVPAATEPEMGSDVADLISSRPADVQTLIKPVPRPSVEELVMIVADAKMVSEDVAYGWLVGAFGSKSEAA